MRGSRLSAALATGVSMVANLKRAIDNLKWGIGYGWKFGVAFSILISVLWVLGGAQSVRREGMPYIVVVACYLAMGVLGGIIVGILRSWSHTRLGAIAIGLFVAAEVFWIVSFADSGLHWDTDTYILALILVPFWGIGGGVSLYNVFTPQQRRRWL
jgi:hypothetical protein